MQPHEAVAHAAEIVGSKSQLARLVRVKPPTVQQWIVGQRPVPAMRAIAIERATGGKVRREVLCPQFPWDEDAA